MPVKKPKVKQEKDKAPEKASGAYSPPKDRILAPDNTAVSPFPDYPGEIKFPAIFSMAMHQAYTAAREQQELAKPYLLTLEGSTEFIAFNELHYRMAVEFGQIDIKDCTNPDKPKRINFSKFEELPAVLAAFVSLAGMEYLRRHTRFPGFRSDGVALSEGRSENGSAVGA